MTKSDELYGEIDFDRSRWTPPERLSMSQWAQKYYYLSAESSAEPGRWRPYPYQVGIMDAISDPGTEQITWMKSARVGATKIMNAMVGYYMHQDPCAVLIVQPTVEDAEGYSKEEIAPMLRDCPVLSEVFRSAGRAKTTADTILHKIYPGGSISMVGANSGRGLRRVSRKVVGLDEVDAYPFSAGSEGDPIKLAIRRTEHFWDRKIYLGSTPLAEGLSRISEEYDASDKRRYWVPCPHCGHFDFLVFSQRENGGHWMRWPPGQPEKAHFVCGHGCGCEIAHDRKRDLVENGQWRAECEFKGHAGFHIWSAYSYSPNAKWAQIAQEFDQSNKAGPQKLKTFVNTVLGETWRERGEAPDYERLYNQREAYRPRTVPEGVMLITAGVDVQKDCIYYEVVGWGRRRENWSIDAGVLYGDTALEDVGPWAQLDAVLAADYPSATGGDRKIQMLAIDSGNFTQAVYRWARRYPANRVIAVKGDNQPHPKALINPPSKVDVTVRGKRVGYSVWMVGGSIAKGELYGWLNLNRGEEGEYPPGYCHFPEHELEFFRQLTGEHLVTTTNKRGYTILQWQVLPGRQNHWLDCRVYARAAAAVAGLDRMREGPPRKRAAQPPTDGGSEQQPAAEKTPSAATGRPKRSGGFLGGRRGKWL